MYLNFTSPARRNHLIHFFHLIKLEIITITGFQHFFIPLFWYKKLLNAVFQFVSKHVNYCCHTNILDSISNLLNCLLLIQFTSDHLTPGYLTWNISSLLFDFSFIWPLSVLYHHQLNIYFFIDAYFGVFTVVEVAIPLAIKLMATTLCCLKSSNHWASYTVLSECQWPYSLFRHNKSR